MPFGSVSLAESNYCRPERRPARPLGFKLVLEIANISEDIEFLRVAVPARIKGEDVLFEGETAERS